MTSSKFTKGCLVLQEKQYKVEYYYSDGSYRGRDVTLDCYFCVHSRQLQELAATSSDKMNLVFNLERNGVVGVSAIGGGKVSINRIYTYMIVNHFWDAYKAITG